ncbi:MAG TPA: YfiR family protein [Verrucomicrobiota bacterium]|nr:DUF4154 domain-containing protein [Verrucomicrobiales bacterium]HRI13990.1 YfiR family protein [Verrucomicrobiota bacterium]
MTVPTKETRNRRSRLSRAFPGFVLVMRWALAFSWTPGAAQTPTLHEYELKAGVLYNIIKYVEWPATATPGNPETLEVGLVGNIPYADALHVLDGKMVQGRRIVVRPISNLVEATQCQVLFIGASEKGRLAQIAAEFRNQPVLTVGEVEGFAEQGGMVNLVAGPNRIVMEINREAAQQSRLAFSSQLLKLAKLVPR